MYSVEQLTDALDRIDKDKFPDRVEIIKQYLKNPGPRGNTNKDKPIILGRKSQIVLGWLSMEIFFWFAIAGLGLLGYAVC